MNFLDMPTIMVGFILINLVCAVVLFFLWRENRSRYQGLEWWMLSFAGNFIGIVLLSLRGILPDFWTMLLGNTIILVDLLLLYIGIQEFFGIKVVQTHNYGLIGLYFIFQIYFVYFYSNLEIRNILISIFTIALCGQVVWYFLRKVKPEYRKISRNMVVVFGLICFVALFRIGDNLFVRSITTGVRANDFDAFAYLCYQLIYIVLTYSLFMLVNRRLIIDLEADIVERKKTEDELHLNQEITTKAFQSSPNVVIITRISDGRIIDTNESFTRLTGFTREEALGNTTLQLGVWANPADRDLFVAEMVKNSRVRDYEFLIRSKSGKIYNTIISGEVIQIRGDECMLSIIRDNTENKRIENLLHLRLEMWEFALQHSTREILQKGLDEIGNVIGCSYSFYRLLDENIKDKALDAGSTAALIEFGPYRNNGSKHPFNRAGIFENVILQKKPVVINDFSDLPDQEPLAEGQEQVIRELLIPVLRENQVVAIFGMVNKRQDFDEKDVEIAEHFATLLWSLVSRKQSEEKVLELNSQLEHLAMMDELTQIPNRRSFFTRGSDEVSRSRRYKEPLSLIMLDIDHFKVINDTYGHEKGDVALQLLAKVLRNHTRSVDISARIGGEEFAILLPNTPLANAGILAERLRQAVEDECSQAVEEEGEKPISITASFGVAEFEPEMKNLDELFRAADTAMYQAKYRGRNRVEVAE